MAIIILGTWAYRACFCIKLTDDDGNVYYTEIDEEWKKSIQKR